MLKLLLRIGKWVLLAVAAVVCIAFVLGVVVMVLWNWIMPELLGLPRITYWQAWGLLLLGHLLFGAGAKGDFHSYRKPKDESPEWVKEKLAPAADEGEAPPEPAPSG
jgi:hypothetical protein